MEGTAVGYVYEDYVQFLLETDGEGKTQAQIAKDFGVSERTIYAWKKKVDWDWVKEQRRKKYAPKILEVDAAMFKAAVAGDVSAAKVLYERFDGWVPTTAQKTIHDLDEGLIDDELKRLMQLRIDTANVIAATVDDGAGKAPAGAVGGEAQAPA